MGNELVLRRNQNGIIPMRPASFNGHGFFSRFKAKTRLEGQGAIAGAKTISTVSEGIRPIALFHKKPRHSGAQKILAQITAEMQYYDVDWKKIKKLSGVLFEKKHWVLSGNLNIRRAPKYRSDALEAIGLLASDFSMLENRTDDKRLALLGVLADAYARLVQPSISQNPLTGLCCDISNWAALHKGGYYSGPLAGLAISLKDKYGGGRK